MEDEKTHNTPSKGLLWGTVIILTLVLVVNSFLLGMGRGELSITEGSVEGDVRAGTTYEGERPKVELFVMSECPYGMQMQKAFVPVIDLLGDKMDFESKFVAYAMHGKEEIDENTRQYCIQQEQKPKFATYLECYLASENSPACQKQAGIDTAKMNACVAAADAEFGLTASFNDRESWLSGRFPVYGVHKTENEQYGVRGSPTLVIDGEVVSVSRSAEEVKKAVCAAYDTPPEECNTILNTAQEAPGAGPVGKGTGGAAAPAANCG